MGKKLKAFVKELNELCKKHKIGFFAGQAFSGGMRMYVRNTFISTFEISKLDDDLPYLKEVRKEKK